MNEHDEDVVHAGFVSKSKKSGMQADFVIRHRQMLAS